MKRHEQTYNQFELANGYKNTINLLKDIERSVLFEGGKQWVMDEDIKDYPKITLNIIKQIGKTRKSNIMQNKYGYLVNSTNFGSVRKIQDFLKHLAETTKLRRLDLKAVDDDYKKGTAIHYFYWDAEKRNFMKNSGGEMRIETIDIRNFAVANPYIQDIQNQEWIILTTRERIDSIKKKYPEHADKIIADASRYTSSTDKEPVSLTTEEEFTNVYLKFFRNEEGQVHFEISTKEVMLKEATPLNPYYEGSKEEYPNTGSLMDEKIEQDTRSEHVWNLYPFARLCLNERDNCFYGYPITMEYIDSQKSINNHFSVYDKALQDNVLGGFVFRKGVIDANEVTTENGQMLELDILPNERIADAFNRIPVANVPQDSLGYSQNLISTVRQVAGASNVQLGMADFSGQSGKQTEMLLQRAKENSSDNAMVFNEFKRDQAMIMFLFAKFFYDNESFTIIEHGQAKDNVRQYAEENSFKGTEYLDDDVQIDIQVGSAPSFSEFTNIELTGLMVQSGQIPFEVYLSMLPDGYVSNREELMELATNNSNKKIEELSGQLEQAKEIIEQMSEAYQQLEKDRKNIDTIINENERLKGMLSEQAANTIRQIGDMSAKNDEMMSEMRNLIRIMNSKS